MGVLALIELEGGEVEFLKKIKEQQQLGHITRKQAYNLRQKIKKVCQEKDAIIENMSKFPMFKNFQPNEIIHK